MRNTVWRNLLGHMGDDESSDLDFDQLADIEINGREIRTVIRLVRRVNSVLMLKCSVANLFLPSFIRLWRWLVAKAWRSTPSTSSEPSPSRSSSARISTLSRTGKQTAKSKPTAAQQQVRDSSRQRPLRASVMIIFFVHFPYIHPRISPTFGD